jgi:hypothetical protein
MKKNRSNMLLENGYGKREGEIVEEESWGNTMKVCNINLLDNLDVKTQPNTTKNLDFNK